MNRRKIVAIIGGGELTSSEEALEIAYATGKVLVDNNFRIVTGGYKGVMREASKGARDSEKYSDGDIIGIIQSLNSKEANEYCDIVIATGIGYARNQIITATGDYIVAIGGGSGTLSELAFAWQLNKPIFAYMIEGWSGELAGKILDAKRNEKIVAIKTPEELITKITELEKKR